MATQLASEDFLVSVPTTQATSTDDDLSTLLVKCGTVSGDFYLDKLRVPDNKGSIQCMNRLRYETLIVYVL